MIGELLAIESLSRLGVICFSTGGKVNLEAMKGFSPQILWKLYSRIEHRVMPFTILFK
jgi:hypothetical protein